MAGLADGHRAINPIRPTRRAEAPREEGSAILRCCLGGLRNLLLSPSLPFRVFRVFRGFVSVQNLPLFPQPHGVVKTEDNLSTRI